MARTFITLLLVTFLAVFPALARDEPPARVGRVSFVSGNLAFHTQGQNEWSAGAVNYPVATGTSLWTEPDGRAEIRIGPNTIAMASGTELDVGRLTAQITQLNLPEGRVYLHVRQLDDTHTFEIAIPRGGILLMQPGFYDVDAGSKDQPARIAVFEGVARFSGNGADIEIKPGDVALLNGFNPVSASIERAVADAFVEWCRSRDYDEKRLAAPYLVSPNMTGYSELDANGRWDTVPGYGQAWYPNMPAGWAPYSQGRWVWVEPWGWTWVDDAPWGFAPSHYGRWAFVGERWCWVPGIFEPSPVYAPALVAFLGGPGVGLYLTGAVGPQIGWFPLAPGELYWPSYTADASYIRRINGANAGNIDNIQMMRNVMLPAQAANAQFANRRFATVVPQHVFANAGKVDRTATHLPASALEHAPVTMRAPQVRPVPAQSVPGPAFQAQGRRGPVVGTQGADAGGVGRLSGALNAAAAPPNRGTGNGGHQPGQPANTAVLPASRHPSGASAHGGTAPTPPSFAGQERHPTWPGATHPRAPAQPFHPPAQAFHPPPQAFHPPAPAFHPPPQAFHPPAQAFHPPAQAARPSAQALQQVAHASQAPKGGGTAPPSAKGGGAAAHGGGGKGDKHD